MKRTIVTLCGSTRFHKEFQEANYEETMAGKIVLSVGFYLHSQKENHGENVGCTEEQKKDLDLLHFDKIAMSSEILVLNVHGYIGESTRREIGFAFVKGKKIRFLEEDKGEDFLLENTHKIGREIADFIDENLNRF